MIFLKYNQIIIFITSVLLFEFKNGFAQLDTIHWIPPLHSRDNSQIADHYIYLSTPSATSFVVTIKDGAGNILAAPSIDNANPFVYTIGAGQVPGTPSFVPIDSLNKVLKKSGLILSANNNFYANLRARSNAQAECLTAKGTAASGTTFRVGGFPQVLDNSNRNFAAGIMATVNNTTVTISGYNSGVVFAGVPFVSTPSVTVSLNAGECYVVSGYTNTPANLSGFIGALVQSNNPIVLNNGNVLGQIANVGSQDMGFDQSVPITKIGQNYILIEGNGNSAMEIPVVIAHYNNTGIYVNGNPVPIATINAGQFYEIPNSNYQGTCNRNMLIYTSKSSYIYQALGGGSGNDHGGLNFIPPYSCGLPDTIDLIPFVDKIGSTSYTGGVMIFTQQGATLKINGVVQTCAEPVISVPWETYKILGLTGNISITSTGAMAAGIFGSGGSAGFAGYFAGFSSISKPVISGNNTICIGDVATLNASIGASYSWSTGATTSSILVSPTSSSFFSVAVTNTNGCTDTASVIVNVNPLPVLSMSGNNTICTGDVVILTASGTGNYLWSTNATTSAISVNPTSTSIYSVVITDANGCTNSDSSIISVNPVPNATIAGNNIICAGETTTLTASGGGTYLWNNGATTSIISTAPTSTATYSVIVSNGTCSDTASSLITVNPTPTANISSNATICSGQTATFTVSGGGNYSWSTGVTVSTISVSPASNTTYSVIVSIGSCSDTAVTTAIVNPTPIANISGNTTICSGQSTTLTASGGGNYSWSTGATASIISVNPTSNATYSVIVSNGICSDTVSSLITVNPTPTANISSNVTICSGQTAIFTASGGGTYLWSNGSTANPILVSPTSTSTYSVIVSIGTCTATASATVMVNPNPTANAGVDATIGLGASATLSANGGTSYNWSPSSGLSCTSCQNPVASPNIITVYCVTATDANGCTGSACVTVFVDAPDCSKSIFLPNAFSPNDDQENDEFMLYGNYYCIKSAKIIIYNRWGGKVFESDQPDFKWNGTYKSTIANSGVYAYYLEGTLVDGKDISRKGNISLIR